MRIDTVVIGGRGYTGSELLPLLHRHPACSIRAVGSATAAGQRVAEHIPALADSRLEFSDIRPETVQRFPAQLYILALPNGEAATWVGAIERQQQDAVRELAPLTIRLDIERVLRQHAVGAGLAGSVEAGELHPFLRPYHGRHDALVHRQRANDL